MSEVLTSRGRRYAEANRTSSLLARIALAADNAEDTGGWPETHINAAIRACNEAATDRRYVVVENTPGYLPEDDDPATFDTFDEALDYASDRATYLVEELDYREVDRSIDRERETASAWFQYRYSTNDLGRVIEVSRLEVK